MAAYNFHQSEICYSERKMFVRAVSSFRTLLPFLEVTFLTPSRGHKHSRHNRKFCHLGILNSSVLIKNLLYSPSGQYINQCLLLCFSPVSLECWRFWSLFVS